MLNNQPFFNDTIRKYTALFGTLFNNISIIKSEANGVIQTINVPLNYSPKDKLFERLKADPDLTRPFKAQLPRMGFELGGLAYDSSRKLQTMTRLRGPMANNSVQSVYNPVPYNLNYQLSILVKTQSDGTRIIEQILPFFTPDWTPTVELIPELDLKYDIPIILDNISVEDSYEGSFDENRLIIWTLDFTLKGYLFGPVSNNNGKVIKFANVNLFTTSNTLVNTVAERITVQPGLTANGEPTSNIDLTVPYTQINDDDNYGYIIQVINL